MASFWPLDAARRRKASLVPGTSRWIAQELNTYNSGVLATAELFAHEMTDDYDFLNGFMARVTQSQSVEDITAFVKASTPSEHDIDVQGTSSSIGDDNINTSDPKNAELLVEDSARIPINMINSTRNPIFRSNNELSMEYSQRNIEGGVFKSDLVNKLASNNISEHVNQEKPNATASIQPILAPITLPIVHNTTGNLASSLIPPSPPKEPSNVVKNDSTSHSQSPIQSVQPNRHSTDLVAPSSPIASTSAVNFTFIPPETDKDDSFQAIRTAIRKSIAGKPLLSNLERRSIFTPLPTKEPLAVESRRKSSSWKALFEYKNELKRSSGIKWVEDDRVTSPVSTGIPNTIDHKLVENVVIETELVPKAVLSIKNFVDERSNLISIESELVKKVSNSKRGQDSTNRVKDPLIKSQSLQVKSSAETSTKNEQPNQPGQSLQELQPSNISPEMVSQFHRGIELGDGELNQPLHTEIRSRNPSRGNSSLRSERSNLALSSSHVKPSRSRIPLKEIKPSESLVKPPSVDKRSRLTTAPSPKKPSNYGSPTKNTPPRSYNETTGTYSHLRRSRNVFMNTEESTVSKVVSSLKYDLKASKIKDASIKVKNLPLKESSSKILLRSGLPVRRASTVKIQKEVSQRTSHVRSTKREIKPVQIIPSLRSPLRRSILRVTGSPEREKSNVRILTGSPISSSARSARGTLNRFKSNVSEASRHVVNGPGTSRSEAPKLESSPVSSGTEILSKREPSMKENLLNQDSRNNKEILARDESLSIKEKHINKERQASTRSSPEKPPEMDLLSRLTAPTSASAAKKRKTAEKKDMSMNKMLTATLNPTRPPKFSPNKNRYETLRQQVANRPIQSPVKRTIATKEAKKSIISLLDDETSNKRQKTMTQLKIPNLKKSFHEEPKLVRKSAGTVSTTKKSLTYLNQYHGVDKTTPGKNLDKPGRVSTAKTPKRDQNPYKTPARSTKLLMLPASSTKTPALPEIFSDDDINGGKRGALEQWAETPELKKVLLQQQNINPDNIFGKIPPLNMDDIFESQASRNRARALLTLSPST